MVGVHVGGLAPKARHAGVGGGEQFRIDHVRGFVLLRRFLLGEGDESGFSGYADPREHRLQGCENTRLPIDERAVAIKGQYLEIVQFHAQFFQRFHPIARKSHAGHAAQPAPQECMVVRSPR